MEKTTSYFGSMDEIDNLKVDHSTLATILRARRAVPMEGMSFGVRTLWLIYLQILEDALKTLDALIKFIKVR
jgi:hypothetical protein